ncbi:MAG: hypothetical protein JO243_18380 [Solirubrobacterales bacterium]|nr:hypothetical protein [Solirubrobacterales bacterium]
MRHIPRRGDRLAAQLGRRVRTRALRAGRAAMILVLAASSAGALLPAASEAVIGPRPCDLYARGATPCVAAYSTTRAMYASYVGPLYRVERSDGASANIGDLGSGYADAAAQDRFCAGTTCAIIVLFDQTPNHNDLTIEGPGANGDQDAGVAADALPVTVARHQAYGMSFAGGMGYRDNHSQGIAIGAQPESMYMVTSGTHFNSQCCFDFGNVETSGRDTGNGHMDAIYFGSMCWFVWPICYGRGPWVQADMENGLFFSDTGASKNRGDTGNANPFVTAMLKNDGTDTFAIKDGNAQDGPLATEWWGPLPRSRFNPNPPSFRMPSPGKPGETAIVNPKLSGYRPMRKEGAIVLGTGGDDSNAGVGSFFEGAMTWGYAARATDAAVQANIVAAGYSSTPSAPAGERPAIQLAPARKAQRIRLVLVCPTGCSVNVSMTLPGATARRLGLPRRSLLTLRRSINASRSIVLRLPAEAIRLAQSARLSRLGVLARVTASAPGAASATRTALVSVGLGAP